MTTAAAGVYLASQGAMPQLAAMGLSARMKIKSFFVTRHRCAFADERIPSETTFRMP